MGYGRKHHPASWRFPLHSQAQTFVKLILFPCLLCLSTLTPALNLQTAQCPALSGTTDIWQRERRLVMCAGSTVRNVTQLIPLLSDIICHLARKSTSS